jgi:hypothetical protein
MLTALAIFFAITLSSIGSAEARWFEPQANWRNAGVLCIASRNPPGRRWRALPPRACAVSDAATAEITVVNYSPAPTADRKKNAAGMAGTGDEVVTKASRAGAISET